MSYYNIFHEFLFCLNYQNCLFLTSVFPTATLIVLEEEGVWDWMVWSSEMRNTGRGSGVSKRTPSAASYRLKIPLLLIHSPSVKKELRLSFSSPLSAFFELHNSIQNLSRWMVLAFADSLKSIILVSLPALIFINLPSALPKLTTFLPSQGYWKVNKITDEKVLYHLWKGLKNFKAVDCTYLNRTSEVTCGLFSNFSHFPTYLLGSSQDVLFCFHIDWQLQ